MEGVTDTVLVLTERDRLALFGPILFRGGGLTAARWAVSVDAVLPWTEKTIPPLKGSKLIIAGEPYLGLTSSDVLSKCEGKTFFVLIAVPAALGRWICAPPPPLLESVAENVRCKISATLSKEHGAPFCTAVYILGSTTQVPPGSSLGWSCVGQPVLRAPLKEATKPDESLQSAECVFKCPLFADEFSGNNPFAIGFLCALDKGVLKHELFAAIYAAKKAISNASLDGTFCASFGDKEMKLESVSTHLGPAVVVTRGAITDFPPKNEFMDRLTCKRTFLRKDGDFLLGSAFLMCKRQNRTSPVLRRWKRAWLRDRRRKHLMRRARVSVTAELGCRILSHPSRIASFGLEVTERDLNLQRRLSAHRPRARGVVYEDFD
ncbi:protein IA [Gallid alphaherpesvirus 1]|uniref:ORF A protein n=2 Tax=Infectious laryngotracheitis virus TaxID=10386 RepID=O56872_ILTV|nr:protein IA [Gallid alphaherpesvirus 1]YP_182346.1 protein IA [Gallid alphaherpesvirus 1]AEB97308.1 protein IA [Gallid alphaherpesvirus 1]AER28041.1 protein IA [Gallid alphaherpesvirus 1]AER28120.1 protein IA [Gallid alphaherpesvirus 1]AEW67761.1 protein IA [Gallid alphaherpesvirus 1]AEW67840.1 protein IA [Gallid alphaherpesvirus 1]